MFNQQLFFLGNLCIRGHRWQDTEQSLRHRSDRSCVECRRILSKRFASTPEGQASLKAADKRYRESEQRKVYSAAYGRRSDLAAKRAEAQLRYRQTEKGQSARKRSEQKYAQTEKRRISLRRKDVKRKKLKSETREFYSLQDVQALKLQFNNSCAYCGSQGILTLDHVIPLNCGGADALRNIVPACVSCNASKQDTSVEMWYKSKPFYSESRWQFLQSLMQ